MNKDDGKEFARFCKDVASIAVRHGFVASDLAGIILKNFGTIEIEISKRIAEKCRRASLPERNRRIFKAKLDGLSRRDIAERFDLGIETIDTAVNESKREIIDRVYVHREDISAVAADYLISENQLSMFASERLTLLRDQLAWELIDWVHDPDLYGGQMGHVIDMTRFLNDSDTTFFVVSGPRVELRAVTQAL